MAKNYISPGDVVTLVAPAAVTAGAGVLVGSLFGIALHPAASGADVETKTIGVFDVAKVSAQAWTQGAPIYWDNTAKLFTTVNTSNTLVGCAVLAAANPSDVGRVRLTG